ncbi:MAG: GNAT family N-acetyltransferase [Phycisphaerales bacterium]|nr:GNAT family N-acetyltransferase [Phycisphaerales bacterium]
MDISIEIIPAAATRPLRQRLLRPHQRAEELVYVGDDDPDSLHLGARAPTGELVGIVTVSRTPPPNSDNDTAWRMRAMATIEPMRGRGIGRALARASIGYVAARGGRLIWCTARIPAAKFYEQLGFERRGDVFEVKRIGPHCFMERRVQPEESAWWDDVVEPADP